MESEGLIKITTAMSSATYFNNAIPGLVWTMSPEYCCFHYQDHDEKLNASSDAAEECRKSDIFPYH